MKHDLPPLDSLKVFEAAARLLSFSRAADELCITKAAVTYQISKLEKALDCALFRRSVRQVFLTEAGQTLLQTTQAIFSDLQLTVDQLVPGDKSHDVVIAATTYVALRWLSPRIARFSDLYPDVSILLVHSVNRSDFSVQDVDVAIRWCKCGAQTDRSRLKEIPMPLFPVCSPALLRKLGVASGSDYSREELAAPLFATVPLLCEDRAQDLWLEWSGLPADQLVNARRVIDDANVRIQSAVDGQGLVLADDMMRAELNNGALVAPFEHRLEGYGYAIFSSPARFLSQKASLLRDWLIR